MQFIKFQRLAIFAIIKIFSFQTHHTIKILIIYQITLIAYTLKLKIQRFKSRLGNQNLHFGRTKYELTFDQYVPEHLLREKLL